MKLTQKYSSKNKELNPISMVTESATETVSIILSKHCTTNTQKQSLLPQNQHNALMNSLHVYRITCKQRESGRYWIHNYHSQVELVSFKVFIDHRLLPNANDNYYDCKPTTRRRLEPTNIIPMFAATTAGLKNPHTTHTHTCRVWRHGNTQKKNNLNLYNGATEKKWHQGRWARQGDRAGVQ
jgi:hypothetical protein